MALYEVLNYSFVSVLPTPDVSHWETVQFCNKMQLPKPQRVHLILYWSRPLKFFQNIKSKAKAQNKLQRDNIRVNAFCFFVGWWWTNYSENVLHIKSTSVYPLGLITCHFCKNQENICQDLEGLRDSISDLIGQQLGYCLIYLLQLTIERKHTAIQNGVCIWKQIGVSKNTAPL